MYVMVYSWPEAISTAQPWGPPNIEPPFGIIFACFMSALTLGSMFFEYSTRDGNSRQLSTSFVQLALSLSALCFIVVVASSRQLVRFFAFCIFEFCVGLYFPSIAYLRGLLVKDAHRATTYGFIRIPLNVFVFVSLISIHEGMGAFWDPVTSNQSLIPTRTGNISRENRFLLCSGLLLVGTYLLARCRSAS